ncbi:MAG: divalent metal cation transporter [Rhodocyclaceae bacterium]|nr:divalent metal cation transporter [Rhodocyclaceae bacterium]
MNFKKLWARIKRHPLSKVGPGMVTGVADDDPSGIVTYSQAGAQFGLNMLWTMPVAYPLQSAIQVLCAQMGRVTGQGLAANIKTSFSPIIAFFLVLSLLVANILNIAADIAAMGEVAQLVTGINWHVMTSIFVFISLGLQVFMPYHRYVFYLKWLTLSLLTYAGVLFTVHVPWKDVLWSTFIPTLSLNAESAAMVVGILGTTISPYLFFWQASQEVEDMRIGRKKPLLSENRAVGQWEIRRIRWDTWGGMCYSNVAAYFIILATAVTLNAAGIRDITTAEHAAEALRPVAGDLAYLLFALGILGVGLIAVPVLAGSAAYALSDLLGWQSSLEHTVMQDKKFYFVIAVSVMGALIIQFSPINPMKALFWSAVINGVVAVPLMVAILILARRHSVMGPYKANRLNLGLGWFATALMAAASLFMLLG